ncbi:sigma-70 family RNA polymerase sigma factor [Pedobacter frigidisoli]|uniref:Sigma-70 family RNA polymerase sigma factor n=1 Tax=Pedobacter frigidisoli TaxID=2530455 RepID=A0A4R0P2C5_9SPHI|nr:sigma-70 family RNA polymerase sigma factor [Pedobacter frigidisoli]TCD05854.1 sigma-70 family RNA polymerase sigma factor [Pedobacter frigidisoli]
MENYEHLSDDDLLIQLKNGNHSAYTEIYNRYFYLMFIFALKKIQDEELSKDFVQELFINLWNKKESLSENGKLASFLYISIRSRIFDHFAHQKVEHRYLDFLKNYQTAAIEKTDHLVRERELSDYIEKQIQALPKKMRQIFELSRKEHLTHKEIAVKLETSEHNVSKQIVNALKIFRTKLTSFLPFTFL